MLGREPKHGLLAGEDGSDHINKKELRQLRSLTLVGRSEAPRGAGVADEAGERPQRFGRLLKQTMKLACVRYVGLESLRPPARLLDFRDRRLSGFGVGGVIDGDCVSIRGEAAADGRADAARASGDDDEA